ncbi:MAG: phosphatidylinositol-binding protein scs2 [Thelocarpon superellum]|nr:MAG: phosphatidylinositol-binding protein scs2 [Thelocarpon superellum]
MSVELSPPELGFQRPFSQEVSQTLHLRNPNRDPVAFKVKTTAPKQYCVRPNSGRIEAGMEVEVQVILQAMKEEPPMDVKCKDKFLVQTIAITADREFSNVAAIWQHVDQTAKSSIQEKKIRVTFIPAAGQGTPSHLTNGTWPRDHDTPSSDPPAYNSPSPEAFTPSQGNQSIAAVGAVSRPESRPADAKHVGEAVASASNPATGSHKSIASSITSSVPTSLEEAKAQLVEARATISRLTSQSDEQGLRQRKSDAVTRDSRERIATGTTGMGAQALQPTEGVPVQIVAALCLLSFLLAYLFF